MDLLTYLLVSTPKRAKSKSIMLKSKDLNTLQKPAP